MTGEWIGKNRKTKRSIDVDLKCDELKRIKKREKWNQLRETGMRTETQKDTMAW